MVLTCVPEFSLTPVAVAVGLLDVPPVEDEFDVELGVNVTPFIVASVDIASPMLIQSSYDQLAYPDFQSLKRELQIQIHLPICSWGFFGTGLHKDSPEP